jgi:mannose-6-phosphate isomerase class I
MSVGDSGESVAVPADGEPRIVLCVAGEAKLSHDGQVLTLASGASCFLSADDTEVHVSGQATLFLASPGPLG